MIEDGIFLSGSDGERILRLPRHLDCRFCLQTRDWPSSLELRAWLCWRSKVARYSNVQNFAAFNFVCQTSIRNIRKFAPYKHFPLYGIICTCMLLFRQSEAFSFIHNLPHPLASGPWLSLCTASFSPCSVYTVKRITQEFNIPYYVQVTSDYAYVNNHCFSYMHAKSITPPSPRSLSLPLTSAIYSLHTSIQGVVQVRVW